MRNLEREIGKALRHAAVRIAEGSAKQVAHRRRTISTPILGPPRFENEVAHAHQRARRGDRPRLDAGRRRHPVHRGDAHARQGQADPDRPARRGDARERAGGAELVKSRAVALGIDPALFEKSDIHVHVPAGAMPKDGPSAGVAMFMALARC